MKKKLFIITATIIILSAICSITAFADGDVAAAVQGTWDTNANNLRLFGIYPVKKINKKV